MFLERRLRMKEKEKQQKAVVFATTIACGALNLSNLAGGGGQYTTAAQITGQASWRQRPRSSHRATASEDPASATEQARCPPTYFSDMFSAWFSARHS